MNDQPLDLARKESLPSGHSYSLKIEKDEHPAERGVRLFKDVALFTTAIALVGTFTAICVKITLNPQASPDAQKFALAFLSALGSGVVGYLIKK